MAADKKFLTGIDADGIVTAKGFSLPAVTLTDATTISWDLKNEQSARLTATDAVGTSRVLPNSALTSGEEQGEYKMHFISSASGYTMQFDTNYEVIGEFDTGANKLTIVTLTIDNGLGKVVLTPFIDAVKERFGLEDNLVEGQSRVVDFNGWGFELKNWATVDFWRSQASGDEYLNFYLNNLGLYLYFDDYLNSTTSTVEVKKDKVVLRYTGFTVTVNASGVSVLDETNNTTVTFPTNKSGTVALTTDDTTPADYDKVVKVNASQSFTLAEQEQGRTNINAEKRSTFRTVTADPTAQNFIDWEGDILFVQSARNFVMPVSGTLQNGDRYFVKTDKNGSITFSTADGTVSIEYNDVNAIGDMTSRSEAWIIFKDNVYYITGEVT